LLPLHVPPAPEPLILYDPTEANAITGRTGLQEATAVANKRGISLTNVLPLPTFGGTAALRNVVHNGYVVIITHGNESTGFTTANVRSNPRVRATADQMVRILASAGLFRNRALPYRFELLICGAASGNDTFARQFYDAARTRVNDVMVKAAVGLVQIDTSGSPSVTYLHFATQTYSTPGALGYATVRLVGFSVLFPIRFIANRLPNLPSNPISRRNLLLHDWYFYPSGSSF
jgi:hypothetical protein